MKKCKNCRYCHELSAQVAKRTEKTDKVFGCNVDPSRIMQETKANNCCERFEKR